jgi:hypothetical protein
MDDSNIVEIYSAANSFEAYAMANALKAAGVKARVVGDVLDAAVGGLAFGMSNAPRVWVLKEDESRARELLKEWKAETKITPEQDELDEQDEPN